MDGRSTGHVREELSRVEKELAAARLLERQTEERHEREGLAETEAVLGARRTRACNLEGERGGLVDELGRRAVAEGGWRPDDAGGALAGVRHGREASRRPPPAPSRARLADPRPLGGHGGLGAQRPLAAEILREHGADWHGGLLAHSLEPVPEEAEEGR